jgi:hypothetical protein
MDQGECASCYHDGRIGDDSIEFDRFTSVCSYSLWREPAQRRRYRSIGFLLSNEGKQSVGHEDYSGDACPQTVT